jgi:hypothetical protein
VRVVISTPLPESAVAEFLRTLAARVEPRGVKVGSYPRWGKKRNTVTLVGRYVSPWHITRETGWLTNLIVCRDKEFLDSITPEVVREVEGRLVTVEGEEEKDD